MTVEHFLQDCQTHRNLTAETCPADTRPAREKTYSMQHSYELPNDDEEVMYLFNASCSRAITSHCLLIGSKKRTKDSYFIRKRYKSVNKSETCSPCRTLQMQDTPVPRTKAAVRRRCSRLPKSFLLLVEYSNGLEGCCALQVLQAAEKLPSSCRTLEWTPRVPARRLLCYAGPPGCRTASFFL